MTAVFEESGRGKWIKMSWWHNLSFRIKMGLVLVVLANLFLALILLVPFLDLDLAGKGALSLSLFVIGEILFYTGLFLVGKELVGKYRRYLNPMYWFNRRKKEGEGS